MSAEPSLGCKKLIDGVAKAIARIRGVLFGLGQYGARNKQEKETQLFKRMLRVLQSGFC